MPLLSVAMIPAVLVFSLACISHYRAEEIVRMPTGAIRPAAAQEMPVVSVRLSRDGAATIAAQPVTAGNVTAAWQREAAAVRLLGFEPSQATVVVHADSDTPTARVERLIAQAEQEGFQNCVLRGGPEE